MNVKPSVIIVGAGNFATFLATTLRVAGYEIPAIVSQNLPASRRRARSLASRVGAEVVTADSPGLDASLLWLCVPDSRIQSVALALARKPNKFRFAFHSSGALLSHELEPLRKAGVSVASVHPLMTFVASAPPALSGVPFALEGDTAATRLARQIVRDLGGTSISLPGNRKAAYHAWATMTSPLFIAFLVILEEAGHAAGLSRTEARKMSLPIIGQTLSNYSRFGAAKSFSGPLIRGDAAIVAKHLAVLNSHPGARSIYRALAQAAVKNLPTKNRGELKRLLEDSSSARHV